MTVFLGPSRSRKSAPKPEDERMRKRASQLSEVRAGGCKDGVDRGAGETFQEAESHPIVGLALTDLRPRRCGICDASFFRSRQIARTASRQMHAGFPRIIMAAIAFVDVRVGHTYAGRLLYRGNGFGQRMAIVRIAFAQVDTHDPVGSVRDRHRHILTERVNACEPFPC